MLGASEVAYILDNAGACGVSVEDALSAIADAAIVEAGITLKVRGAIREQHANTPAGWECVQAWMQHANTDAPDVGVGDDEPVQMLYRTEAKTAELQSLMRHSYAAFSLKKKKIHNPSIS